LEILSFTLLLSNCRPQEEKRTIITQHNVATIFPWDNIDNFFII